MGMERKVLIIDGMTCINCQNKIEQELKNTAGISKVQVSYSKVQAEIEFNPEIVTLNRIAAIIEKLDYTVIDKKQADSLKWVRRIGTLAVIILLYYLLQHFGILNLLVPSMLADSQMSYGMLFIVGLLTSVHCIAMCGGIHLSQCIPSRNAENTSSSRINVIMPSVLYNAGRVVSYTAVGFVLGGAGMILTGGSGSGMPLLLQGILKITAGLFMVIMGINMLGIFPALRKLQIRFPRKSVIKNQSEKKNRKKTVCCRAVKRIYAMRSDAVYADYCTRFGQSHIGSTGNADVQLRHGSADAGAWKPCIGAWGKIYEACHADRRDTDCGARTCNAFTGSGSGRHESGQNFTGISQYSGI